MKRELKAFQAARFASAETIAGLIPMKRELKADSRSTPKPTTAIAGLIPMKRELKDADDHDCCDELQNCRAHPDEKGTERNDAFILECFIHTRLQGSSR